MANEKRPLVLRWRTAVLNSAEPASTKLTLLALAEHANANGAQCRPSIETIATQCSQSEKTCREALKLADGRWFTRTPIKLQGRDWRGYEYRLSIPEGAVTVTGPRREAAVTDTAPQGARSGNSRREVRKLTPRGPVTVTDDLGKAPRKSTYGEKKRSPLLTFGQWFKSVGKDASKAIPDEDPIWDFAESAGIPNDFMQIAWAWFESRYQDDEKQYRDWRAVFRRAVREDWHRCWRTNRGTGDLELTEAGLQLQRLIDAESDEPARRSNGQQPDILPELTA